MNEKVESGELSRAEKEEFLSRPIIARIATVSPDGTRPHVVPVWFLWDGSTIWISSYRSTRKARDLLANPFCSVVIDEAENGLNYRAVLFEGRVELVDRPVDVVQAMFRRIYERYLGPQGVLAPEPQEWIHDPENLLIKLTPGKARTWYSRTVEEP